MNKLILYSAEWSLMAGHLSRYDSYYMAHMGQMCASIWIMIFSWSRLVVLIYWKVKNRFEQFRYSLFLHLSNRINLLREIIAIYLTIPLNHRLKILNFIKTLKNCQKVISLIRIINENLPKYRCKKSTGLYRYW